MKDEGIFLDANICLEVISIYYIFVPSSFFSKDNGVSIFLGIVCPLIYWHPFSLKTTRHGDGEQGTRTQKQEVWLVFKAINHFHVLPFYTYNTINRTFLQWQNGGLLPSILSHLYIKIFLIQSSSLRIFFIPWGFILFLRRTFSSSQRREISSQNSISRDFIKC